MAITPRGGKFSNQPFLGSALMEKGRCIIMGQQLFFSEAGNELRHTS